MLERLSSVWRHTNQSLLIIQALHVAKIKRLFLCHLIGMAAIQDYLLCTWKLLSSINLNRQITMSLVLDIWISNILCQTYLLLLLILRDIIHLAQLLCVIDVLRKVWLITQLYILLLSNNIGDPHLIIFGLILCVGSFNSCNRLLLLHSHVGNHGATVDSRILLIDHLDLRDLTIWSRCSTFYLLLTTVSRICVSILIDSLVVHLLWLLVLLKLATEFLEMVHLIFATNNPELLVFAHTII